MTTAAPLRTPLGAQLAPARVRTHASGQARLLVAVVLAVTTVDQLAKAWAWRHLELIHINSGTGLLLGDRTGAWYRDADLGPLLDGVAVTVVLALAVLLVRRPRPPLVFLGLATMLAGWASNLGDRLGLHAVTSPGTGRGVVDFIRWNGRLWNVADLFVIAGAVTCVVAGAWAGAARRARTRRVSPPAASPSR
jgi:lipoprotein signal peptidase